MTTVPIWGILTWAPSASLEIAEAVRADDDAVVDDDAVADAHALAKGRLRVDDRPGADFYAGIDRDVGEEDHAVPDRRFFADDAVGADRDVPADFSRRGDDGRGMDAGRRPERLMENLLDAERTPGADRPRATPAAGRIFRRAGG